MKFIRAEMLKTCKTDDDEILANIDDLLDKVNAMAVYCPLGARKVNSGYRSPDYNKSVGGATKSAHTTGKAIDIEDKDGLLALWVINNYELLEKYGLRCEFPQQTIGWCHLDTMPVNNNRIFGK